MNCCSRAVLVGWSVATLATSSLAGQTGVLRGVVRDDSEHPLDAVEVLISGSSSRAFTAADGTFRLEGVEVGKCWVIVRRLGYAPARFALTLSAGSERQLEVTLEALPARLPDQEVRSKSGLDDSWLVDFQWRSRVAWGTFLTRDDLSRWDGEHLTSALFSQLPARSGLRLSGFRSGGCYPAVSIDGRNSAGPWNLDGFRTEEVEAVEVYRPRAASLPVEFLNDRRSHVCGLVVVWLRRS